MAENKKGYENIAKIEGVLKDEYLSKLFGRISEAEKSVSSILREISEKERAVSDRIAEQERQASELAARLAAEQAAKQAAEQAAKAAEEAAKAPKPQPQEKQTEEPQTHTAAEPEAERTAPGEPAAKQTGEPVIEPPKEAVAAAPVEKSVKAEQQGGLEDAETKEIKESKAEPRAQRPSSRLEQAERTYNSGAERQARPEQAERTYNSGAERQARPEQAGRTYDGGAARQARPEQAGRTYNSQGSDRPAYNQGQAGRTYNNNQTGERPPYQGQGARTYNNQGGQTGQRPPYNQGQGQGARTYNNQGGQTGQRPPYGQGQGQGARTYNNQGTGARPPYGQGQGQGQGARTYNSQGGQTGARPPYGQGQGQGAFKRPATAVPPPAIGAAKAFGANKKKSTDTKSYEEKKTLSKRALIKQQISVEDFDENKSGYRKLRLKKQKEQQQNAIKIEKAVLNTEIVPLKVLSEKIGISAVEITKKLFKENIFKTINDTVDFDTAALLAADLGIELELKMDKTAEEVLTEFHDEASDSGEDLAIRPPVVTVMGHVDHGKTSLLDRIRSANVTSGEAGGITQHIGAYSVTLGGKMITFIDTPGHAAFTSMRARGAQVTDIVIIVVAADDGIMPQTVEAINHAKAAGVSIIAAVNKIDKPTANIDKAKQQLTENGLVPEEWGGDVIVCPLSAKTGEGVDKLLESISLIAELKELKANPGKKAKGVIIEAQLDKGKGPVATVLVQNGTLKVGDSIISGTTVGRVRAMIDDKGKNVKSAGPSVAVSILGLEEVPEAGENIYAVEQDKLMKSVAAERKKIEREGMIKSQQRVTLDDVFGKIAEGNIKNLNIIVKADVQGSVEAVKQSLATLSNEEVKVNIIHSAAGAINESDVTLADSSNAILLGFNVRADVKAKALAERSGVDVRSYRIIYELLEDMENALKGMLAPKYREVFMGKCEVRETFRITGVGMVAGCYVTEGKLVRNGKLRIYRNDIMIIEGGVRQLKRFKDDVKEVASGYECGVSIENFNEIKVGDFIECYIIEELAR